MAERKAGAGASNPISLWVPKVDRKVSLAKTRSARRKFDPEAWRCGNLVRPGSGFTFPAQLPSCLIAKSPDCPVTQLPRFRPLARRVPNVRVG